MVVGSKLGRWRVALLPLCMLLALCFAGPAVRWANAAEGGGGGLFDDIDKPMDNVVPPTDKPITPTPGDKPITPVLPDKPVRPPTAPGVSTLAQLRPEPSPAAQAAAEKLINEVFKVDLAKRTDVDRLRLARKLIQQGNETRDDDAARYVCFRLARDLAVASADIELATNAIDQMATCFAIDGFEHRFKTLSLASAASLPPPIYESITEIGLTMLDAAIAADDYPRAQRLGALVDGCANKTRRADYMSYARSHLRQMNTLRTEYEKVRAAVVTLQQAPDQPEACDVVGRYCCFGKGDWTKGLPFLLKSPDATVAALAKKDLAIPSETKDQLELADGWWAVAEKHALCKLRIMQHAAEWYRAAAPNLSGVHLSRVNGRLETLGRLSVEMNPAVNLLALINAAKDARRGLWSMEEGALFSDNTPNACLQIPYAPPGEYDFRITFTRLAGTQDVAQILPNQSTGDTFSWRMGAMANRVFGFATVDNHTCDANTSTIKVPAALVNGRAYTAVVQVRNDGVKAFLDGQLVTQVKGDLKNLTTDPAYAMSDPALLGIGANTAPTVFHTIELVEINGRGKRSR